MAEQKIRGFCLKTAFQIGELQDKICQESEKGRWNIAEFLAKNMMAREQDLKNFCNIDTSKCLMITSKILKAISEKDFERLFNLLLAHDTEILFVLENQNYNPPNPPTPPSPPKLIYLFI